MSLAAATVVATMSSLGGVHLDADAQGRAQLTWSGYRGNRYVTRVLDVTTGRKQDLWSAHSPSIMELSDFDVAASGAAVACFRDRTSRDAQTWRVKIMRRSPQGVWSSRRLVASPRGWVEELRCGIGDGGQVALSWAESFGEAVKAAFVAPDGTVEPPVTLAPDTVDPPQIEVARDGSAAVTFTVEKQDRVLQLSERPVSGGWRTRAIAPAVLPHLAMDGAGRAVVGWSSWREGDETLSFAAGPAFTPAPFVNEPDTALGTLVAGARGDVLAAWHTNASRGDGFLRAAVARPGAPFSPPSLVGRFSAYPLIAALGADGSGAVAAIGGSERRPRPYVRVLRPDGTWGARIKVQDRPAGLAPAGPGRFTLATTQPDRSGSHQVLRVRTVG